MSLDKLLDEHGNISVDFLESESSARTFWNNARNAGVELLRATIPFARMFQVKGLKKRDYDLGDFSLDSVKAGLIILGAMDLARYHDFGTAPTNFRFIRDLTAFTVASAPHLWQGFKEGFRSLDDRLAGLREQYENNSSEVRGFDRSLVVFDMMAEDRLAFILFSSAWLTECIRDNLTPMYNSFFKDIEQRYWAGSTSPQHFFAGAGITMLAKDYLKATNSEGFARNRKASSFLAAVAFSFAWEAYEIMDSFNGYAEITKDTCADLIFDFLGSGSVLWGDRLKYGVSRCYYTTKERLSRLARS